MFAGAACLYLAVSSFYYVGLLGDDAAYLLGAQSLLLGKYVMLQLPGHPPMTVYPPGYPLFIAPFVALTSSPWLLLKILSIGVSLVSVALTASLARTWVSPQARIWVMGMLALNPVWTGFSFTVMSEPVFICSTLCAFILLRRLMHSREAGLPWVLGSLVGYCALVRSIGVALIVGVLAGLVYLKRYRTSAQVGGIALCVFGLFIVRNQLVQGQSSGYGSVLISSFTALIESGQLFGNVEAVWRNAFAHTLLSFPGTHRVSNALIVMGVLFLILRGHFPWRTQTLEARALTIAIGVYVVLTLIVLSVWNAPLQRYALPLLPFLIIFFIQGVDRLRQQGAPLLRAGAWLLLLGTAVGYAQAHRQHIQSLSVLTAHPAYKEPLETWNWIQQTLPRDAVLVSAKCAETYLNTQRSCLAPIPARDREEFRYRLLQSSASFILTRPFDIEFAGFDLQRTWQLNQRWAQTWPQAFEEVHRQESEAVQIFRVRPSPGYVAAYQSYRDALEAFAGSDTDLGLKKLDQALALQPDLVPALNAYAATYYLSNQQLEKATRMLKKAVQLQPEYVPALLNLTRLSKRQGRLADAQRYWQAAAIGAQARPEFAYLIPLIDREKPSL